MAISNTETVSTDNNISFAIVQWILKVFSQLQIMAFLEKLYFPVSASLKLLAAGYCSLSAIRTDLK